MTSPLVEAWALTIVVPNLPSVTTDLDAPPSSLSAGGSEGVGLTRLAIAALAASRNLNVAVRVEIGALGPAGGVFGVGPDTSGSGSKPKVSRKKLLSLSTIVILHFA